MHLWELDEARDCAPGRGPMNTRDTLAGGELSSPNVTKTALVLSKLESVTYLVPGHVTSSASEHLQYYIKPNLRDLIILINQAAW